MFDELELIRQKGVKKVFIAGAAVLVFSIIAVLCMMSMGPSVFMICLVLDVVVMVYVHQNAQKKYEKSYKEQFLKSMIEKEFDEVQVNFEKGFSEEEIREGHLVTLYDRFYSNDYLSGKRNGIPFEWSDIKVEDVVRSGKHTTVVTRFQGMYMRLKLKKQFSGWMVVKEKEFLDNGNPRGFFSDMPELMKIQTEDEVFNNLFGVFASDGTEAFYLLTPRFMEKMIEIESKFEGRCYFGFIHGQFHVAIDSRIEHFELGLFDQIDEMKLKAHENEILMIKELIDLVAKECESA